MFFYSPKKHIEHLWKEIYKYSSYIGDFKKRENEDHTIDPIILEPFKKEISRREKLINEVMDFYLDPEDDGDYIEEYRP